MRKVFRFHLQFDFIIQATFRVRCGADDAGWGKRNCHIHIVIGVSPIAIHRLKAALYYCDLVQSLVLLGPILRNLFRPLKIAFQKNK